MKRGTSGLSLVVGVDKPQGLSSHDVVTRCRRIFGEKRIGHTGTLDPMASGALMICIGPAARLNPYMTLHDKCYEFTVSFGASTDTDDSEGRILRRTAVPDEVLDPFFAQSFVAGLVGKHRQIPPAYSAIKVKGERSYKAAREGNIIELDPREIEVYEAQLNGIDEEGEDGFPHWRISAHVSKGTYIRSLGRDIGNALGSSAHVSALRRTQLGALDVADCASLEHLERVGESAALDPVMLLGNRLMFTRGESTRSARNGSALSSTDVTIYNAPRSHSIATMCSCTSSLVESDRPLVEGEMISVVSDNQLVALYQYREEAQALQSRCVFAVGVSRGNDS